MREPLSSAPAHRPLPDRTYVRSMAGWVKGPLRRAALPLELQLPRWCFPPRGTSRRGGAPRSRCTGANRPRRHVRRGALRRGSWHGRPGNGFRRRGHLGPDQGPGRRARSRGHPPGGAGAGPYRLRPVVQGALCGPSTREGKGAPAGRLAPPGSHRGRCPPRPFHYLHGAPRRSVPRRRHPPSPSCCRHPSLQRQATGSC